MNSETVIKVRNVTMAYGSFVVMHDLTFDIRQGDIFIIMGGSGCGKSTLMKILIGLKAPAAGDVYYHDVNFWQMDPDGRKEIMKGVGITYQSGALWSSMTLAENVALPLETHTRLPAAEIAELVSYKLSLVGLAGFESYYPYQLLINN